MIIWDEKLYEHGERTFNALDSLEDFTENEMIEVIKTLDKSFQDWGFTEQLAAYFFCEMLKLLEADDEYKNEAELIEGLKRIGASNEKAN